MLVIKQQLSNDYQISHAGHCMLVMIRKEGIKICFRMFQDIGVLKEMIGSMMIENMVMF